MSTSVCDKCGHGTTSPEHRWSCIFFAANRLAAENARLVDALAAERVRAERAERALAARDFLIERFMTGIKAAGGPGDGDDPAEIVEITVAKAAARAGHDRRADVIPAKTHAGWILIDVSAPFNPRDTWAVFRSGTECDVDGLTTDPTLATVYPEPPQVTGTVAVNLSDAMRLSSHAVTIYALRQQVPAFAAAMDAMTIQNALDTDDD